MVNNKDLQLKNLESEKIIEEQGKEREAEMAKPFFSAEKEKRAEIQPADRQKVLDEIKKFEDGEANGLAGISLAGISNVGEQQKEREKQIEKILETGLEDIYLSLSVDKQREFKAKGEETIKEINTLLGKAKVKVEKIIRLIKKWLSLIPGVNKFFLEQEAKIKADEIIKLRDG